MAKSFEEYRWLTPYVLIALVFFLLFLSYAHYAETRLWPWGTTQTGSQEERLVFPGAGSDDGRITDSNNQQTATTRPTAISQNGCQSDLRRCPSGVYVERNPNNNCEFYACPTTDTTPGSGGGGSNPIVFEGCPQDTHICPDGTELSREESLNCGFPECPEENACAETPGCDVCAIAYECPKDLEEGEVCAQPVICEYTNTDTCATQTTCGSGTPYNCAYCCPQGYQADRERGVCIPSVTGCTDDAFECLDGSFVGRDPSNNCAFAQCPQLQTCDRGCEENQICVVPPEQEEGFCYLDNTEAICIHECGEGVGCTFTRTTPPQVVCADR